MKFGAMRVVFRKEQGVTLLEMILVLAIAGLIITLSLAQYFGYERQSEEDRVKANVDLVFHAMQNYYQANCIQNHDYSPGTVSSTAGALDPSNSFAFPAGPPVPPYSLLIDIDKQLVKPTPTTTFLARPILPIPLVDSSGGYQGYVAQFNLAAVPRQAVNTTKALMTIGTVYLWRIQVAVKMLDVANISAYKNAMAADCVSDIGAGGTVIPCGSTNPSPPETGAYLVWERLPSFASPSSSSSLWPSIPLLKQFKDQYTHDILYEMNNAGTVETSGGSGPSYYLCGG